MGKAFMQQHEYNIANDLKPVQTTARLDIPRHPVDRKTLELTLLILMSCLVLSFQFLLREFDNNRLLNWQWVMQQDTFFHILLIVALAHIAIIKLPRHIFEYKATIYAVIAIALALSISTWSTPEFMLDSARYFSHAKIISTYGLGYFLSQWGSNISAWTDLPLPSLLYGSVFAIFGESRQFIQFTNSLLYVASLYLTYQLGKGIWGQQTGIYAAILLLAFPFLSAQPSQLLIDIPSMFFVILALYTSFRALQLGRPRWMIIAACSISLALLCKYSVWLVLTSLIFIPLAVTNANSTSYTKIYKRLAILFGGSLALVLLIGVSYYQLLVQQISLLLQFQLPALSNWHESLVSTFLFQIHPLVSLAAVCGIVVAIQKRDYRILFIICAIAVLLLVGVRRARYMIIIFPLLALLAAYALSTIKNTNFVRLLVPSVAITGIIVSLVANNNFLDNISAKNVQTAGHYLNEISEPYAVVVTSPLSSDNINPATIIPILDYYSNKPLMIGDNVSNKFTPTVGPHNPLSFTWVTKTYPYRGVGQQDVTELAIVHISSTTDGTLPKQTWANIGDFILSKSFVVHDRSFKLQTIVKIYRHKHYSKQAGLLKIHRPT